MRFKVDIFRAHYILLHQQNYLLNYRAVITAAQAKSFQTSSVCRIISEEYVYISNKEALFQQLLTLTS